LVAEDEEEGISVKQLGKELVDCRLFAHLKQRDSPVGDGTGDYSCHLIQYSQLSIRAERTNSQSNLANPSYKDETGESKTMGRS